MTTASATLGALLDREPDLPSDSQWVRVTSGPAVGLIGRVVTAHQGRLFLVTYLKPGVYLDVAKKIVEPCAPPQDWSAVPAK